MSDAVPGGDRAAGEWSAACDGCCTLDDPGEMYLCGSCEALLCLACYGDPPGGRCEACVTVDADDDRGEVWWCQGRTMAIEDVAGPLLRELL